MSPARLRDSVTRKAAPRVDPQPRAAADDLIADDVFAFHLPATQPNFITQRRVTAPVSTIEDPPEKFEGTILFIPSADPGFDWIFTRGIAGFVTQFGGVNSHMAIRARELDMPAVIGAGESLFQRWRPPVCCAWTARTNRFRSSHEDCCHHPACCCRTALSRAT